MTPAPASSRGARLRACAAGIVALAIAGVAPAPSARSGPSAQSLDELTIPPLAVDTFSLDNGLRVIVSEDHSTPLVAVEMWYHVGSAHEPEGRSGFAHLFEHLFFEDTEALAEGEFKRLVTRAGGVFNGTTDSDRTAYGEVLPSHRVNLALWSHAERMTRLRIDDDDFETQRRVVEEERKLRVENQPYAGSQLTVDTIALRDFAPYRHPVIGSMDDLDAATADDAREFYGRFYTPNNAVLTVVGDVTLTQVRALVEEYFGEVARGPEPPSLPAVPTLPRTDGERRRVEEAPLARLPLVWMAYTLPPAVHPDHPALALLSQVLGGGEASRLRKRLVDDEAAAIDVVARIDRRRGPGVFLLGAAPVQGVEASEIEALLDAEVERLLDEGVTAVETAAALNQVLTGAVTQRMTVASKAALLQRYALYHGSPHRVNEELERFRKISPDELLSVARTWLQPENRTVVIAQPLRAADGTR
ncbi:MAG: insulinase family protein [Gemmatimonadetes bacterium]|nr:insulinase family protein [Gemmatimonadota bacterium]